METPLRTLLATIRKLTEHTSEAEKGHSFEVLTKRFLETEPTYKERFSEVWTWDDWPCNNKEHDSGIDLVAKEAATDNYIAIQCKCYAEDHRMAMHDLETFFAAYNRTWPTGQPGRRISFAGGIIVATTDRWNETIRDTIANQEKPCQYIGLTELENAPVDWEKLGKGQSGEIAKYAPKPHQQEAIDAVLKGLETADRGKMIMACGTGKTFTALRLAKAYTQGKGCVLFLAPSIALVAQSLREWMCQTVCRIHPIAVCSDANASRNDDLLDITAGNLASPATTDPEAIARNYARYVGKNLTVIFSTYQSLDKVQRAQQAGALPEFDLCICDEAHRTTGVSLFNHEKGAVDESQFVRIHDKDFIKCRKRVYMTATPRVYAENARKQAKDAAASVASMDDPEKFGHDFFRLPFSRAVREGLLTDYKVLVLCVDEEYVKDIFEGDLPTDEKDEVKLDEAVKLVGCYNGLRKKVLLPKSMLQQKGTGDGAAASAPDPSRPDNPCANYDFLSADPQPMKRAVAFTGKIAASKANTRLWAEMMERIREREAEENSEGERDSFLPCVMDHVDGTMDMNRRQELLSWLKGADGNPQRECRILSNARCLSEGVDVPSLDAVIFMSPRRSKVDVVQSVGRVMRLAPGKKYGYIILPIGIPADAKPEDVLDKDEKYAVVWDVLQALRSHDDRFNAEINSIELNQGRGDRIAVAGVTGQKRNRNARRGDAAEERDSHLDAGSTEHIVRVTMRQGDLFQGWFDEKLESWKEGILVRAVQKCGTRRYWENWAKDIAEIAERQAQAIQALVASGPLHKEFGLFLSGLQENIRPDISEGDAVEMLAQQLISRPVFNALFNQYDFADNNPVSVAMNRMLGLLEGLMPKNDLDTLQQFYKSVEERARSIDNAAGRQRVVVELYDQFFKNDFPKMAKKLGIVYTPVDVVDFIIHSVHHVLQTEFGIRKGIGAPEVRVLDPFTGTGTFLVRLIQSGLVSPADLKRKYQSELFACEIVLLAYYIACVNIEVAYHGAIQETVEYSPFKGICLTDTFRMQESAAKDEDFFPQFEENGERVKRLCQQDIRVIIGNPPYSAGQKSANDNNQNEKYPKLDSRIAGTYAAGSKAQLKNSLYDSYIRAFRWASDRITDDGILAFVTNGSFIDNNAMAGFRKSLMAEFSSIYCFNLRGFIRGKTREDSRKEGQNIFDIMTGVCITVLVKKKGHTGQAALHYHDIGDYLAREQKLEIIRNFKSIAGIPWQTLTQDEHGDWINHRTAGYEQYLPMGDKETKGKADTKAIFQIFSNGVKTNRDAWCYNFGRQALSQNMKKTIDFYLRSFGQEEVIYDSSMISWSDKVLQNRLQKRETSFSTSHIQNTVYRPFCKEYLYCDRKWNDRQGRMLKLFPTPKHKNLVIQLTGNGSSKPFSCLVSSMTCDLEVISKGQCFPLYWYEKREEGEELALGLEGSEGDYIRHDGITDYALKLFRQAYRNPTISKEEIFYYIYGLLHSREYRTRFANDLKKELPRIPFAKNFRVFCEAGRELAELHLNYERIEPWDVGETVTGRASYRVRKMRFPKKGIRDTIIYNDSITLSGIPEEAYDYVVNGKSAIEWLMERYAVTTDKASGITNDPNAWCEETGDPRYIIDLVKRIIRLSMETVRITSSLPPMEEL